MNLLNILFFLVVTGLIYGSYRRFSRALSQRDEAIMRLQRDINALTTAGAGISGHMMRIEHHLAEFGERQHQLETWTRVEQSYSQAIRLASEGAGTDQLIEDCGLVRDEAELLRTFYQQRKAS